jgi:hypothetical protein
MIRFHAAKLPNREIRRFLSRRRPAPMEATQAVLYSRPVEPDATCLLRFTLTDVSEVLRTGVLPKLTIDNARHRGNRP